jgi:hypothetical protein
VFSFSQELIKETILVFREEDGIEISPEKANEYLNNMAGLFLAMADKHPRPLTLVADGDADARLDKTLI